MFSIGDVMLHAAVGLVLNYVGICILGGVLALLAKGAVEWAQHKLGRRLTEREHAACIFLLPWSTLYVVLFLRQRERPPKPKGDSSAIWQHVGDTQ